jgi:hypothetical protein
VLREVFRQVPALRFLHIPEVKEIFDSMEGLLARMQVKGKELVTWSELNNIWENLQSETVEPFKEGLRISRRLAIEGAMPPPGAELLLRCFITERRLRRIIDDLRDKFEKDALERNIQWARIYHWAGTVHCILSKSTITSALRKNATILLCILLLATATAQQNNSPLIKKLANLITAWAKTHRISAP